MSTPARGTFQVLFTFGTGAAERVVAVFAPEQPDSDDKAAPGGQIFGPGVNLQVDTPTGLVGRDQAGVTIDIYPNR